MSTSGPSPKPRASGPFIVLVAGEASGDNLGGKLIHALKERLPGVNVVQGDATRLDEILVRHGVDEVATVISGIPMVGNPISLRRAIVGQGMKAVRPGGFMLQYSYSPIAPIPAADFGVKASLARYVLWNVPPASVWKYTKLP